MRKASEGPRGKTRRSAPKTIDLAASEVSEKKAGAAAPQQPAPAERAASDRAVPPAEPVAMTGHDSSGAGTGKAAGEPEPAATTQGFVPGAAGEAAKDRAGEAGTASPGTAPGFGRAPAGQQPGRGGFAGSAIAAVLGAVVALAVIGGLNQAGLLRHVPLLSGLAASDEAPQADAGLTAQVVALDKRLAGLEESVGGAAAGEAVTGLAVTVDGLAERVAAVESGLEEVRGAQAALPGGTAGETGEAAIGELSGRVDALAARIDGMAQEIAERPAPAGEAADAAALKELQERIGAASASGAALSAALDAVSGRIDAMETALAELREQVAAAGEARSREMRESEAARAVAVSALAAAYRRGEPFAELLDSLEILAGSMPALQALKPHAAAGIATDERLRAGFDEASAAILSAAAPPQEGVIARLIDNARSLVEIRPAGPVEGDSPQAIVSRIEAGLAKGAPADALAEWQSLPEAARAASRQWGHALERRVAADRAMQELLAGLGQPSAVNRQ